VSERCKDLIKKLLTVNPAKRIRIEEIKNHTFFKQGEAQIMKEMPFENEKPSELILEKVSDILGNTREEILYNIEHNRHNNTTTSYELLLKRYKLNMGENVPLNEQRNSLGISGYQTTRNKTVDSFKEQPQTKSINININYVNKIGNININISDPIGKDDSKSGNYYII